MLLLFCQSPVSLVTLRNGFNPFVYRRFVSLTVLNSFFLGVNTKETSKQ